MQVTEFLDHSGIRYDLREHRPVFTSQGLAQREHERGRFVAKPVIVKADGRFLMCVLPADAKIDLETLKGQLNAKSLELADEADFASLFPDCEVGAEPPFGNLFNLDTVMDKSLEKDDHILFRAGSHTKALRVNMADYRRLAHPRIFNLCRQ